MGNMWQTPLSEIIESYNSDSHPICKPLVDGGPALLAEKFHKYNNGKYIDSCHLCFLIRSSLLNRYPQYLAPKQVYGLEPTKK